MAKVLRVAWPMVAWLCCGALLAPALASEVHDPVLELLQARGLVGTAATAPATVSDAAAASSQLVLAAMNFLDIDYRYGGSSVQEGFDCSGFTRHVFSTALGLRLPRRSAEQASDAAFHTVGRDGLQPGDLVFFNTLQRAFSHVGLYIGDGRFVHSPRSGAQVRVESLRTAYWSSRFDGARRVGTAVAQAANAPVASTAKVADAAFDGGSSPH